MFENKIRINIRTISLDKIIGFCIVFLAIVCTLAPYQGDSTLGSDSFRLLFRLASYAISFLLIISILLLKPAVNIWCLIPIVYWLITWLHPYRDVESQVSLLNIIILFAFFYIPDDYKPSIVKAYRSWIILMCGCGIISYISYTLKIGLPYSLVDYYSKAFGVQYYADFKISYIYINSIEARLCGLFNEPGYLGTICGLLLCLDKINLKKIGNIIILVAGVLTFSVAFLVLIIVYLSVTSVKTKTGAFIAISLGLFYFLILPNIQFSNPKLAYLVHRISFNETGLIGNDRSNIILDSAFSSFWSGSSVLWGNGGGFSSTLTGVVSSYKTIILDYGILGFILMYGSLLFYSIKTSAKNWYILSFIIVFFLNIYQRPGIYNAAYFLILVCGLEYMRSDIT